MLGWNLTWNGISNRAKKEPRKCQSNICITEKRVTVDSLPLQAEGEQKMIIVDMVIQSKRNGTISFSLVYEMCIFEYMRSSPSGMALDF